MFHVRFSAKLSLKGFLDVTFYLRDTIVLIKANRFITQVSSCEFDCLSKCGFKENVSSGMCQDADISVKRFDYQNKCVLLKLKH